MYNLKNASFVLALLLMISCGEQSAEMNIPSINDVPMTFVTKAGDHASSVANLTIEGMTCEIGCAGKIRKELSGLAGVINTEVAFSEKSKTDVASVEFDPSQIDAKAMVEKVHSIMEGMYIVKSVEVVTYENSNEESEEDSRSQDEGGISLNLRDLIPLPQLFQVLHR